VEEHFPFRPQTLYEMGHGRPFWPMKINVIKIHEYLRTKNKHISVFVFLKRGVELLFDQISFKKGNQKKKDKSRTQKWNSRQVRIRNNLCKKI
jgi:hypothetical protein